MKYTRGDIILANLPYTDRTGSKIRPALVVQNDRNNARLDDVILAMITRTTSRSTSEPSQLLCEHLITLHRSFVQRVVGRLPDTLMHQVNDCLKASLGLT